MATKKKTSALTQSLVERALELQRQIEGCKELYRQLDDITLLLCRRGFKNCTVDGKRVQLVDRFAKKNTIWKAVAMRQYELEVVK